MGRLLTTFFFMLTLITFASTASLDARNSHYHKHFAKVSHYTHMHYAHRGRLPGGTRVATYRPIHYGLQPGQPANCVGIAWCGCFLRSLFGGGPEYNVAANWANRGVSTTPHVGAVVVWRHHVGEITGYDGARHQYIVLSGNDGHRVRTRPRSLAGAIAFRNI